jgi:hypothetical protein
MLDVTVQLIIKGIVQYTDIVYLQHMFLRP